jgi:dynein axonemal assembly factor 10
VLLWLWLFSLLYSVRVYDVRTQHPELGFAYTSINAHKSTVWQARHMPQNREVFMSTGGNGTLNLYKYSYPAQRVQKDEKGREYGVAGSAELISSRKVSEQPVVSFDWNAEKQGLCAFSCLDSTIKVGIVTKTSTL